MEEAGKRVAPGGRNEVCVGADLVPRSEVTDAQPASVEQQSGSSGLVPGLLSAKTTLELSIDTQGSLTAMNATTKAFTSAHHNC